MVLRALEPLKPLYTMTLAAYPNAPTDSAEEANIFACKNEQKGDFEVEKLILEIGGKSKPSKSADFVIRDDVDLPAGKQIPMWALGMMY
jgi:hypothetical protein